MKRMKQFAFLTLIGVLFLAACAPPATPAPVDVNELNTAIAHTAAVAMALSQAAASPTQLTFTPTASITPSATLGSDIPTLTFTPTVEGIPTPPVPIISVSVSTNCRSGPGKVYDYQSALVVGKVAEILATEPTGKYWLIHSPDEPDKLCWVWGQYATIAGDTSQLPVYTPPPTPTRTNTPSGTSVSGTQTAAATIVPPKVADFELTYIGKDNCGANWWVEFNLKNVGDFALHSVLVSVFDSDTHTTVKSTTNGFPAVNGCAAPDLQDFVLQGASVVVSAPAFSYDMTGHEIELTVNACSKNGQTGTCKKHKIEFVP